MTSITVLIIASKEDIASINIQKELLRLSEWKEIGTFLQNPIYNNQKMRDIVMLTVNDSKIRHENIDKEVKEKLNIDAKQAIFISRHRSKTGEPTLTVHPIGNFGEAEFGGISRTLVKSSPRLMTHLLRILNRIKNEEKAYQKVCFEVTHHGPYLEIPTLFIEVGSNEDEWAKIEPANIVARSLLELFGSYHYENDLPKDIPVLLGIGGGHYAPRITDVALEKKVAFGHMIPTYQIDAGTIDDEIIDKCLKETPNFEGVYIHRKALKKSQVTQYKNWFEKKGIKSVSSKELTNL